MNFRKSFIGAVLAIACVALVAPHASGQQYTTASIGATNSIVNNATTTANLGTFPVLTKYGEIGINISGSGDQAGTGNLTFTFELSPNGTTWPTVTGSKHTIVMALAGNTAIGVSTNLSLGSFGYMRLKSVANADANASFTNCVVRYSLKPKRIDGK